MTQSSPSQSPSRLGRYEIVDELGKGAMGVVYLARDPLIGRLVALKTFRVGYSVRDLEMEQFRARFIREAQSAGILSHPGIVTIHDVVEGSDEGVAFIAMEYVRGTNLKALLQRDGPLDVTLAAAIVEQVADALDYAHTRGVVHRDIKPANIILTAEKRVKITDFGIARLDTSNLTQEGQLLGTPNYMAPEQILGKDVDNRADIFSLGVVLYEMLTRHKPFQGDNLTVVSHRIVYDHFTPPRQYIGELPPGVERVLSRALEKDPAARYQRAGDLAEELKRAVAPVPSGEALNDTMSFSEIPLLPPPPMAAPGAGSSVSPARPPGPPLRDRLAALARSLSWERVATEAFAAAALSVLIGAVALLALGWGPVPSPTPAEQARGQVLERLAEGHAHMRAGRWGAAVAAYREAERLAPDLPGPRRLRQAAARKPAELQRLVEEEQRVGEQLGKADLAMATKHYEDAALAATTVVAVDPRNQRAQEILARANRELADAHRKPLLKTARPAARDRMAAVPNAPADDLTRGAASEPAGPPAASVPTSALVKVRFDSAMPKGYFRVMMAGKSVCGEPFDFYKKGGFLRRRTAQPGRLECDLTLAKGQHQFLIYVTPDGKKAMTKTVDGDLAGGSHHRLSVVLTREGELSAHWEDAGS